MHSLNKNTRTVFQLCCVFFLFFFGYGFAIGDESAIKMEYIRGEGETFELALEDAMKTALENVLENSYYRSMKEEDKKKIVKNYDKYILRDKVHKEEKTTRGVVVTVSLDISKDKLDSHREKSAEVIRNKISNPAIAFAVIPRINEGVDLSYTEINNMIGEIREKFVTPFSSVGFDTKQNREIIKLISHGTESLDYKEFADKVDKAMEICIAKKIPFFAEVEAQVKSIKSDKMDDLFRVTVSVNGTITEVSTERGQSFGAHKTSVNKVKERAIQDAFGLAASDAAKQAIKNLLKSLDEKYSME